MKTVNANFEPTIIEEWSAEDMIFGMLADEFVFVEKNEAREMLDKIKIGLPADLAITELTEYSANRTTPFSLDIPPDLDNFSFYLVDFPLNILVPEGKNIVRLGLELELLPGENQAPSRPLVAFDLFPPDQWQLKETNLGETEIDISKALTFIPTAGKLLGDGLGLKLKLPIKWMTETVQVRTTDRMSNPVCWLVTDKSIQHGFTAYTIIRSPKGINVNLNAVLTCDLRSSGILGKKTHGKTPRKTYHIS